MDPDITLAEIRTLVTSWNDDKVGLTGWQITELVERVEALDDWITNKKGFLPTDWRTA